MRLFVAIDLDDRLREAVGRVSLALRRDVERRDPRARVTWAAPDGMHVTLHFLGAVEDPASAVRAVEPAIDVAPFDLEVGGLGVFPEHGRPRVIWLGVRSPGGALSRVHRIVGDRLKAEGLPVEPGPFSPHLTLARVRTPMRPSAASPVREAARAVVGRSRVDAVTLYESRLGGAGPTYLPLATGRLVNATTPHAG